MRNYNFFFIFLANAVIALSPSLAAATFDEAMHAANDNNYSKAIELFLVEAKRGHAEAQNNLGVMYDNGQGVPQDFAEAAKWYRLAADQGLAGAQFNLGLRGA